MPTGLPLILALSIATPGMLCAQSPPPVPEDPEPASQTEDSAETPDSEAEPSETGSPEDEPTEVTVSAHHPRPKASFDRIEHYDSEDLERSNAFTISELLKELPPGPAGTAPVILINGRETALDIKNLPAGMIERLEVNLDGGMPNGRPRVAGEVINIIMKTEYHGGDVNLRQRNAFEGGGGQGEIVANAGYTRGDFNATFNATHQSQNVLAASQREISSRQDHTAQGGRDFRLPWGAPPVVQALNGNLNGVFDENGQPVATALAPIPSSGVPLTPSDFTPGPSGTSTAEGLRHFDTADFLQLIAPSKTTSAGITLGYVLNDRIQLSAGYNYTDSDNSQMSPPPVTDVSSGAIVPAAFSPFGQDVAVGFVHVGFGGQRQDYSSVNHSAILSVDGKVGEAWTWNAHYNFNLSDFESAGRELDAQKLAAAMAATDPAERFDPFAGSAPGSSNARLYPSLTRIRTSEGEAQGKSLGLYAGGPIYKGWVGPVLLNLDVSRDVNQSHQEDRAGETDPAITTISEQTSLRGNGSLQIPVFKLREPNPPATLLLSSNWSDDRQEGGAAFPKSHITTLSRDTSLQIPWLTPFDGWRGAYRLETELGIGQADRSGEKSSLTRNAALAWSPLKPLTLRARLSRNQVPPPSLLFPVAVVYNQTFSDPLRNVATATDVQLVTGAPVGLAPSFNESQFFSMDFEPAGLSGLSLGVNYNVQSQRNPLRNFGGQDVIDNEAALPGRVTRLSPTPDDIAAGQPGAIVKVDVTPLTTGASRNRSLGISARLSKDRTPIGDVHIMANATHLLKSTNELLPGVPVISSNDQESPPDWVVTGMAFVNHKPWQAGLDVAHTGTGRYSNTSYSAFTTVGVRVAYQFDQPLWGRIGKRLQLGCGIQNLFDEDSPRVDTVMGFRGESPIGRTYELTLRAPLGG